MMLQRQAAVPLSMGHHALLFALLSCISASDVTRQAEMSTCELVRDFGYTCETLNVATEDGYIIQVDRVGAKGHDNETIPSEGAARGRPILLAPGILVESGSWFLNMPSQSTGFLLADDGYEVWAMNAREVAFRSSHLSLTSHLSLSQSDDRFWQWSFHQIGYCDLAAVNDLVLNTTGVAKVPLLAYSQGFTSSLDLLSMRPEYNEKTEPPAYPLEKVTVPVAVFSFQGDTVAAPRDVEALAVSLGSNMVFNHVLSDTDFRHVNFLSGYQARDLLYEPMINALKNRTVGGFGKEL